MGLVSVEAFVLSMLLMSFIPVLFSEETESLLSPIPGPVAAPIHPPTHHHHHHHKTHPPTPPPVHPHPPTPPPVHPPSHHHHHHKSPPPSHPPVHPPTPTPTPAPIYPPRHHHHPHPKSPPPVHPPSPPPSPPPVHPPSPPPSHPPSLPPSPHYLPKRSFLAVQGVVFCKFCKFRGIDTLEKAKPLLGAVVKLECNNTKYPLVQEGKTDKNGYFYIEPAKKITTYGAHKCKVSLVSSPNTLCNKPTDLHAGLKGAILMRLEKSHNDNVALFSVGPFAFEPPTTVKCPP